MKQDLSIEINSYEGLFEKVLNCCSINKNDAHYEDYLQLLRLDVCKYLEEQVVQGAHHPIEESKKSEGYLFRRLSWLVRDIQRQNWRHLRLQQKLAQEKLAISYFLDEEKLEVQELLGELDKHLNEGEREFLHLRLEGLTIAAIARHCQVSRQMVYKWRSQVQKKFKKISKNG